MMRVRTSYRRKWQGKAWPACADQAALAPPAVVGDSAPDFAAVAAGGTAGVAGTPEAPGAVPDVG